MPSRRETAKGFVMLDLTISSGSLSRMCGPGIQLGSCSISSEVGILPNKILCSPVQHVSKHLGSALTVNPSDIQVKTSL